MLFFKLLLLLSSSASLVAQMVKNLPAVQETWVRSLGLGDPLEEERGKVIEVAKYSTIGGRVNTLKV